jgi:uncharacterized protein (TIGR03086 family)
VNELEPLLLGRSEFEKRLVLIEPTQWSLPTPCDGWDVRKLVNHVVAGNNMSVALLLGAPASAASKLNRADALGSDPIGAFRRSADDIESTFREEGILDKDVVHHPGGDIPAAQLLNYRIADYGLHSWDLARAIGADETLPPGLVGALWDALAPIAEYIQHTGVYGEGPSGDVRDDAPLQLRLLDVSGRRPQQR